MHTIEENTTHRLELEYQKSGDARGWWLTLVTKSTGEAQIIISKSKAMWDGVSIEFAQRIMKSVKPVKMYSPQ